MTKSRSAAAVASCVFALVSGSAHTLFAQGAQDYIVQFRPGVNAAARRTAVGNSRAAVGRVFVGTSAA